MRLSEAARRAALSQLPAVGPAGVLGPCSSKRVPAIDMQKSLVHFVAPTAVPRIWIPVETEFYVVDLKIS